ncbi:S1 RNA-binding domain-containing protein [Planctomycetes bacterium K23_9]|uniref:General stress protein 13 n=1 Tax=Stieleria marina TaxID=1930275 RepID=A0A517P3B9_9BACT|nr:General stress protein 13 [Planctomycetes bacterium K23_9]
MTVDLEAIARRGRCDVSSLRIALPLLQQGYSPPFLARYRRDELSGLSESNLWALSAAVRADEDVSALKADLEARWQETSLQDPAIGNAIRKSNSQRVLDRLARRVKQESGETPDPSTLLAIRALNPQKGDSDDLNALAESIEAIEDASAAVAGIDEAIAKRLTGDPRIMSAAVRWLAKHARIHVSKISDPHTPAASQQAAKDTNKQAKPENQIPATSEPAADKAAEPASAAEETQVAATPSQQPSESESATQVEAAQPSSDQPAAETTSEANANVETSTASEASDAAPVADATPTADTAPAAEQTPADASAEVAPAAAESSNEAKPAPQPPIADKTQAVSKPAAKAEPAAAPKKAKKISPRQRRRRWLVSVLKPLSGKRFVSDKLSSFQIVMLGRAMRSQVAECSFEYDAAKLVEEIKRVALGLNRSLESKLSEVVMIHEANIREAAESAWWDELHERASVRLAGIAADHLRAQINRGGVDAKIVMSIDAVGPRTAATAIVSADGQVLHCEDLPCQLSSGQRAAAVAKMGELIHAHHVDLIVISNGPSRRASMIALGELIRQSPESSLRWTLADRSGADTYAGSDIAGQEMRSTSRRFRAAAWLAFSILQPAHALSKVDPSKLRLASFQRELAEEAMKESLDNVMTSGASRGGVDANGASVAGMSHLPGMTDAVAKAIDGQRRKSLIKSRDQLLELEAWQSVAESRQALPFLRVFGSDEALDGTLIHPDDYALAKKLAKVLEIELPPTTPPGYQLPQYLTDEQAAEAQPGLKEAQLKPAAPVVEDLTKTGDAINDSFGAGTDNPADSPAETDSTVDSESAASGDSQPDDTATPSSPDSSADESTQDASADSAPAEESSTDSSAESEASESPAEATSKDTEAPASPPEVTELVKRPRPEKSKIDKCIKEWQVGPNRVNQLVSWLCDPFGDSDESGEPPAVMTSMPTQKTLQQGDQVIGVVVGVMPFGVFVELAPDCSGLVHVSKATDSFVEDLHEAIQVGDVITAWVTSIDNKKKRVALSAISPEREAQLREEKQQRSSSNTRGQAASRGGGRGAPRGGSGGQAQGGGQHGGKPSAGKTGTGGQARGGGGGASRGKPAGRGGGGRGGRPDSRGGRGGRREKTPETYNVVGKKEKVELTDEMKKGAAPLRSFGDLMQFFDKDEAKPKQVKPVKQKPAAKPQPEKAEPAPAAQAPAPPSETPAADPPADQAPASETPAAADPKETPDS